ncbi:MAG: SRPBCC domain-containing protein [Dehalococcoidia bacterium]
MAKADSSKELEIVRVFDAPRELVWKAWTDPELMMRWWGPRDYTCPACSIDFEVGGTYLNCMRSPEDRDYWSTGVYKEIVEPERLVMSDSFSDESGNVVPATHYGMNPDFPLELLVTLTLEDYDGKTKLTLRHAGFPSDDDLEGARAGWSESFDKLAAVLRKEMRGKTRRTNEAA